MFDFGLSGQINLLENLSKSFPPIEKLITGGAYLLGIMFMIKAIYTLKMYGESKSMMSSGSSIKEPLMYFLVGGMLVFFPTGLRLLLNTTFGDNGNILAYGSFSSNNNALNSIFGTASPMGRQLCRIIQIFGLVAFVRGWVLIARSAASGQQAGSTGKGFMHVFGGMVAINIVGTIRMLNNTLFG